MSAGTMLARRRLRLAALGVLQGLTTTAGVAVVESPPATATQPKQMPYIGLRCGIERKAAVAGQMPNFTTTVALEVTARVAATTQQAVQDAIEALGFAIEQALLGAPSVVTLASKVVGVTTTTEINAEGSAYQAESLMAFDFELPEWFDPTQIAPANYPALQGLNLHVDAGRPYDANGIYTGSPFPASVIPAPRASGPDGRDEGYAEIDLPQ